MELPTQRGDYSKKLEMIDPDTGEVKLVDVHNDLGQEIPDPIPMAPPIGYQKPLSMFDQMRAQIRAEHVRLRQMELEQLRETPEQANDFDVDEDIESMPSLYEEKFDPVDFEVRNRLRQREFDASVRREMENRSPSEPAELLDGSSLERSEPRGSRDTEARSRKPDTKRKDDTKPVESASDRGSVSEDD